MYSLGDRSCPVFGDFGQLAQILLIRNQRLAAKSFLLDLGVYIQNSLLQGSSIQVVCQDPRV